jgi:hypothetical protein
MVRIYSLYRSRVHNGLRFNLIFFDQSVLQHDLDGEITHTDRIVVKKLYQTYSMQVSTFTKHGTAVNSTPSAG